MSKNVKYYVSDKVYRLKNIKQTINLKKLFVFLIPSLLFLLGSIILFINSVKFNQKQIDVSYSEIGNADYKVYLKENEYYEQKYLSSGMQYIANLVSSVNTEFNYAIHSNENLNYEYKYKINAQLQITDNINSNKIIHTKNYVLLDQTVKELNSNNLVINEDVDIDYDEFNNYVNEFKRSYGLSVDSNLLVTMEIDVNGVHDVSEETLNKQSKLQILIPLSEQTIDIVINTDTIDNSGTLTTDIGSNITNKILFDLSISLFLSSLILFAFAIYLYIDYRKRNIYSITLKKLLREYDRLIVNGKASINEKDYKHRVYPEKFSEMVDASQNLGAPILFYEVIPGEKSFFVIVKDDFLYKFRLTKSYLENKKIGEIEEDMHIEINASEDGVSHSKKGN